MDCSCSCLLPQHAFRYWILEILYTFTSLYQDDNKFFFDNERGVNQENLGNPTSKNEPKWTNIPFYPLAKIANCREVCASHLVPLRHKPQEDDDE